MSRLALTKARAKATRHGWDSAWIRTELDVRAVLDGGCRYDLARAQRVVNFFDKVLHHVNSATGTTEQFRLLDWQDTGFLRPLFGWVRADGTRRYRRAGLWVPKKNGKSTLAAGLELYMLMADGEPAAEVYSAANDRAQASIIYTHAAHMVELSPILKERIGKRGIIRSTKTIHDAQTGSIFRALSADAPTKEGLNTHALIVDEIHAMRDRALWDSLVYGGASRRQPLIASISTAGVYDITAIGWEQYRYARDIATGVNDRDWSFFAVIYEAKPDDDWMADETARKANPSYGVTVQVDALREECVEAQMDPQKENTFRRYRLNQWVQQATRWIPIETWDKNHVHAIDKPGLRGRESFVGMDLASVRDLTAAVILTRCPHDDEAVDVTARFWIPHDALADPRNRNAVLYQQWHREGLLETTPGSATDYDFIEAAIVAEAKHFAVQVVAIDALFQGQSVANHLEAHGIPMAGIGQTPKAQGPATKEFQRLWLEHRVHHGGHPILRWMADNVEVKADADGNLKIVKPNHHMDPRKVDGISALVNAVDALMRARATPEPQYQMLILGGR
jgi:phage terminase large subunit-like protein